MSKKVCCGVKAPTSIGSHGASPAPVNSYLLEIVPCACVRVRVRVLKLSIRDNRSSPIDNYF